LYLSIELLPNHSDRANMTFPILFKATEKRKEIWKLLSSPPGRKLRAGGGN